MNSIYISYLQSPIGIIGVKADSQNILSIWFINDDEQKSNNEENIISLNAKQQLHEYFQNQRKTFELPLYMSGTDFQNKVWHELERISIGKTISYLQLAKNLGDAKCIRAAGTANGKNPFAIVVPCHRVIGSNDSLVGYAGGLWRKRWLLEHEQKMINGVVNLFD